MPYTGLTRGAMLDRRRLAIINNCYVVPLQQVTRAPAAETVEYRAAAKRFERNWIRLLRSRDSGFNSYIPGGADVPFTASCKPSVA